MTTATAAPVKKREIFGWAMYDFANSSYTTVVVTFIYSAFFVSYIVPPELAHLKNTYWSLAIAVSTGLAIVLAPFVGILCDYSGNKKKYLAWCTGLSILGTGGLFIVEPGNIGLGLTFLILSNTAWMLSESFIASFLPELTTEKNIGKVSGFGWGIGYIGGLASLLAVLVLLPDSIERGSEEFIDRNQLAMISVAFIYLIAALPTFIFVKERAQPKPGFEHADIKTLLKAGFERSIKLKETVAEYPVLFHFFIAFMIYCAGMAVVVKFFGIYTQEEVGITGAAYIQVGLILQVSAAIGAIMFGFIEDKIGSKRTILLSLIWWITGLLGIYFIKPLVQITGIETVTLYIGISFIAGSAMGATYSASRAMVGILTKPEDSALMFGLWGTFGRFAIIIGMTFGPISDWLGNHTALLTILVYFVVGGVVLISVPIKHTKQKLA